MIDVAARAAVTDMVNVRAVRDRAARLLENDAME
jgi:hypothetical protein